jgi:predicted DNA-binding transcriptional regulator AlpA
MSIHDTVQTISNGGIHMIPTLPETGYIRLNQILGAPKAHPPIPAIIPVSKSTWWAGVKSGRFPRPTKLSPRITVWRVEDIREFLSRKSDPDEQSSNDSNAL